MKLTIKQKRTLGSVMILITAIMVVPVLAQLLSNQVNQQLTLRGQDGQVELSLYTPLTVTEPWFGETMWTTIEVHKLKPLTGTMIIEITNDAGDDFDPSMMDELIVSHRNAAYAPTGTDPRTWSVKDNSTIQYSETLYFAVGESDSFVKYEFTFGSTAPGGTYSILIYVHV